MSKETMTSMSDQELEALVKQRQQKRVEDAIRELDVWLDEHGVALQVVVSFSPEGLLITQIKVIPK